MSNNFRRPYPNELMHYGILGMKWGVRRYQNADGSYTEEGKKHYGSNVRKTNAINAFGSQKNAKAWSEAESKGLAMSKRHEAAVKAIENGGADYKEPMDKITAVTQDCYPFSANISYAEAQYKNPGMKDRAREAADLALQVLADRHYVDQSNVGDNSSRWWVLYEDQTFGYGLVADMINRGYTAKQVQKMIDVVETNYTYDMDEKLKKSNELSSYATFDITYGNWNDSLKTFAEDCEKVKNS